MRMSGSEEAAEDEVVTTAETQCHEDDTKKGSVPAMRDEDVRQDRISRSLEGEASREANDYIFDRRRLRKK
jgi:hypothetical protein